mmetsp:Transcript_4/g.13  ORF Transcript_4/g.13 Transcript_4/m.13 type:complete len:103 (-) Transcript_4:470-778(-)
MMAASEERRRQWELLAEEETDNSSVGDETFEAAASFFPQQMKRTRRRFQQIESAATILRHAKISNPSYTMAEAMKVTGIAERWCENTVLQQKVIARECTGKL